MQSSFDQTWPAVEVIVVDDGSTDGTNTYLQELSREHDGERLRYVQQTNQGPSSARNTGLRLARGEFIKFLDSDDALKEDAIAKHVACITKHQADLCIGARSYMSPEGTVWSVSYRPPRGMIDKPLLRFFNLELKPQGALWFFRKEVFDSCEWNEDLLAREDTELLTRLLVNGNRVCGSTSAVYCQRYHDQGRQIDIQFEDEVLNSIVSSNERQLDWLVKARVDTATRRAFASSMCRTVLRLWDTDRNASLRLMRVAKEAFPVPELKLHRHYNPVIRLTAYVLWLMGGPRLCAAVWGAYRKVHQS